VVIRLVAKVHIDTMEPTILYPADGGSEERIALLTGIIQLVSAALEMSQKTSDDCAPRFMKSERGVIGYCTMKSHILICEGDEEKETREALRANMSGENVSDKQFAAKFDKGVKKRGDEIGDLWR
jgi:hypothetical protein